MEGLTLTVTLSDHSRQEIVKTFCLKAITDYFNHSYSTNTSIYIKVHSGNHLSTATEDNVHNIHVSALGSAANQWQEK